MSNAFPDHKYDNNFSLNFQPMHFVARVLYESRKKLNASLVAFSQTLQYCKLIDSKDFDDEGCCSVLDHIRCFRIKKTYILVIMQGI